MSGAAVLRCDGLVDPGTARKQEHATMQGYLMAGRRALGAADILCICSDAGRVGDPPEESVFYMAWSPLPVDLGMLLPVQVPMMLCSNSLVVVLAVVSVCVFVRRMRIVVVVIAVGVGFVAVETGCAQVSCCVQTMTAGLA